MRVVLTIFIIATSLFFAYHTVRRYSKDQKKPTAIESINLIALVIISALFLRHFMQ